MLVLVFMKKMPEFMCALYLFGFDLRSSNNIDLRVLFGAQVKESDQWQAMEHLEGGKWDQISEERADRDC